jgi:hypothetical protein
LARHFQDWWEADPDRTGRRGRRDDRRGSSNCSGTPGAFGFDIDNPSFVAFKRGALYLNQAGGGPGAIRVYKGTASAVNPNVTCGSSAYAVVANFHGDVYFSAPANPGASVYKNGAIIAEGGFSCADQVAVPVGLAVHKGNVYVADQYCNAIWEISGTGTIRAVAGIPGNSNPGCGAEGVPATSSNLGQPRGVAVDLTGNIYVADWACNRVRKVEAATGLIYTIAGPPVGAPLGGPWGIATAWGKVYVGENTNSDILVLTPK